MNNFTKHHNYIVVNKYCFPYEYLIDDIFLAACKKMILILLHLLYQQHVI